ncbi:hypothetical protein L7F22_038701 [Adiantum nelumboides]|nr:hypothetical protein [Adiantum nelumboides]
MHSARKNGLITPGMRPALEVESTPGMQPTLEAEFAIRDEVVHDDVHIDVDLAKLEKDAIADATVVDACTNDNVDAMEVDASIDFVVDGNVNDGGIESIVHAIIYAILDAVEAMGTDATIEAGIDAIVDAMLMLAQMLLPRWSVQVMRIADAEEAKGTDAVVEDMRGLGEEDLTKRVLGIGSSVGNSDVVAFANTTEAGERAVQSGETMGEVVVAAMDMKEANTHDTIEVCIEQNNEAGKGTEVPIDRAVQLGEAMGEHFMAAVDMKEAVTHDTTESCTNPTVGNTKGKSPEFPMGLLQIQMRQIIALPPMPCEEKKRRDNLCIILDMNGLLIRRSKKMLYLSQEGHIDKVLQHFNMDRGKALMTPLPSYVKLSNQDCPLFDEEKAEMDKVPYASACGTLMYAMIATHPDIAFAVGVVSRYMSNPGKKHWEAVKGIMRYLKHTKSMCICYGSQDLNVRGYIDSHYAGDLDKRRSMSGYVFTLAGGAVSWRS